VLMLTTLDLAPVQERFKTARTPMPVKLAKACDGRGLIVEDPDGFSVMIVERSKPATGSPATKSNFTSMRFGYLVSGNAIEYGPFVALGLVAQTRSYICRPVEDALLNAGGASSVVTLPGGFEIWLVKGKAVPQRPDARSLVRPHDPGAAVLRLMVSDVDAAVQALGQAQVRVVSAGGAIQALPPGGLRAAILGASDDLLIQVVK